MLIIAVLLHEQFFLGDFLPVKSLISQKFFAAPG